MKRIVFIALVILTFNVGVFAQNSDRADILKTLQAYAKALKDNGSKGGLLFVYPKVFGVANKQEVLQRLDNKPADISKALTFERLVLIKMSKIRVIDGVKYALVTYQDKYSHSLALPSESEEARSIAARLAATHTVSTLAKSKKMILTSNRQAYFIKDLTKGWKLVERNKAMESVLQKILPVSVLNLP